VDGYLRIGAWCDSEGSVPDLVDETLSRACVDLARTMARARDAATVLGLLAERVVAVVDDAAATVVLTDSSGNVGSLAGTDPSGSRVVVAELDLEEGPSSDAVRTGAVVQTSDLQDDPRWPRYRRHARSAGIRSVLAVPLVAGEHSVGVVDVFCPNARHWQDREVALVTVLADLVSSYLARAAELAQARRTADQLRTALESRIEIEQAKGILVGELGCSVDQAFALLRGHARSNNVTLHEVARAVVHLGLRPPGEHSPRKAGG